MAGGVTAAATMVTTRDATADRTALSACVEGAVFHVGKRRPAEQAQDLTPVMTAQDLAVCFETVVPDGELRRLRGN